MRKIGIIILHIEEYHVKFSVLYWTLFIFWNLYIVERERYQTLINQIKLSRVWNLKTASLDLLTCHPSSNQARWVSEEPKQ